jgi:hypothetical protein
MKSIDHKKSPEGGITSKIIMWTFDRFPQLVTSLEERLLSQEVEEGQNHPPNKTG